MCGFSYILLISLLFGNFVDGQEADFSWKKNTNFWTKENWIGDYKGNCSGNIFSFPEWMEELVVNLPKTIIAKQIILPRNGHFLLTFPETTLTDKSQQCQRAPIELKFKRESRASWFDWGNWERREGSNPALASVERVPCQFHSVNFPQLSSFHLEIPGNISVGKFLLASKVLSEDELSKWMGSKLGKIQFGLFGEKMKISNITCKDNDLTCICRNYQEEIKNLICGQGEKCAAENVQKCLRPIWPNGFCCPICGIVANVKHKGELKLTPVENLLKTFWQNGGKSENRPWDFHASRVSAGLAQVVFHPKSMHLLSELQVNSPAVMETVKAAKALISHLKKDSETIEVKLDSSWESDALADHLNSNLAPSIFGISAALLLFLVIVSATGCYVYLYYNKTETGLIQQCLNQLGNLNLADYLRSNASVTSQGMTPGFGFARFSNERVSSVDIQRSSAAAAAVQPATQSSSSNDKEDCVALEKITEITAYQGGFSDLHCDVVAPSVGAKDNIQKAEASVETANFETSTERQVDSSNDNSAALIPEILHEN